MKSTERRPVPPIRPATLDDVPEIRSILAEHGNDGPHPTIDIVGPYVRHLIETARALVADEGDRLAAFGATVDTGRARHLADLFVRSDRLGQGIGRPLLDELFADDWPRTTFASEDERALPLYVRAGMAPLWTILYVRGDAATVPDLDGGLMTEPSDPTRLALLELEWTGLDRSGDHAFWAIQAEADPFIVVDGGDIVAAGYGRARQKNPARFLDRLVIRPGRDPIGPTCAALRRVARGGSIDACIPGPSPVLRSLLEAGFRIDDRDTFMASEPDLFDPARLLPSGGML